jgi:DNA polymerase-3 subunit epsilon
MGIKTLLDIVKRGDFVVLDTETTGLGSGSEIIEIAIIDPVGRELVNTRVCPLFRIPKDAAAVHGITDKDVMKCPQWRQVRTQVREALYGRDVIIYNAAYDTAMLTSSDQVSKIASDWQIARFHCAMLAYGEYRGVWNDYHNGYKWHRLTAAVKYERLTVQDAHSAAGDCQMTLALLRHLVSKASR